MLSSESPIHIDAVIDPLSPSGQKLTSILQILGKYFQPNMRIVLNPLVSSVSGYLFIKHFKAGSRVNRFPGHILQRGEKKRFSFNERVIAEEVMSSGKQNYIHYPVMLPHWGTGLLLFG